MRTCLQWPCSHSILSNPPEKTVSNLILHDLYASGLTNLDSFQIVFFAGIVQTYGSLYVIKLDFLISYIPIKFFILFTQIILFLFLSSREFVGWIEPANNISSHMTHGVFYIILYSPFI